MQKEQRTKDKKYLAWVGSRGMGMKADDRNCIPLCQFHHRQLHTKFGNEDSFFQTHFRSADYGKELAQALWCEYINNSK